MFGLAHESPRGNSWVGGREQRPTSEPDSEIRNVCNHRRIKQIRRPELPARPTFQPPEEMTAPPTQGANERLSWLNKVEFHREGHDSNRCTADTQSNRVLAISSLNLDRTNLSHRARTAAEMTHLYVFRRDYDLAITEGLHVLPMYAQTEWPGTSCVRCMKS